MTAEEYKELMGVDFGTYNRLVITGKLLYETETHYVTQLAEGVATWDKKWYRPMMQV